MIQDLTRVHSVETGSIGEENEIDMTMNNVRGRGNTERGKDMLMVGRLRCIEAGLPYLPRQVPRADLVHRPLGHK